MKAVIEHYNKLIDENNDPARDSEALRAYMDKWDGDRFIESMRLDTNKTVLEIGVGTGRLAMKVAPQCQTFCGIDISEKTVQRAKENLAAYQNVNLICDDFMLHTFETRFDVIYSSLTFMHIQDKQYAIRKVSTLLQNRGLFVLSIDKNQDTFIDMGTRKIKIYPDDPDSICRAISDAGLERIDLFETEHAYIIISQKAFSR